MRAKMYKVLATVILFLLITVGVAYIEKIVNRQMQFNERDAAISTVNGGDGALLGQIAAKQNVSLVKHGYIATYGTLIILLVCTVGAIMNKKETETETKEEVK